MISRKEFLKEAKEMNLAEILNIPVEMLENFYDSTDKIFLLHAAGKPDWKKILELEDRYQWPLLRLLDNPRLPIYAGADENERNALLTSIDDERKIRLNLDRISRHDYENYLKGLIEKRQSLLRIIFQISDADMENYKKVASRKINWTLVGTGAVVLGVIGGTYAYRKIKSRNKENNNKK